MKTKVPTTFEIVPAQNTRFLWQAKLLFKEDAAWLGIDLSFQHVEEELANLLFWFPQSDKNTFFVS